MVVAIVAHSRILFGSILRECAGGNVLTALLTLRSLTEAAILVRWIEMDPIHHVAMWMAEDQRNSLSAVDQWRFAAKRRGWPPRVVFAKAEGAAMRSSPRADSRPDVSSSTAAAQELVPLSTVLARNRGRSRKPLASVLPDPTGASMRIEARRAGHTLRPIGRQEVRELPAGAASHQGRLNRRAGPNGETDPFGRASPPRKVPHGIYRAEQSRRSALHDRGVAGRQPRRGR
jgi:hypothetical protein